MQYKLSPSIQARVFEIFTKRFYIIIRNKEKRQPRMTKQQLKANRSRWNWKLREFAGHSCWDTFLTVDFINEKL